MAFQIFKIDRDILVRIENLLSASAGYQTSMPDELEYFDSESSKNWFVALDKKETPIGFIRCFNQGEWSQGEVFVSPRVDRKSIATDLLKKFIESNTFESGHRLRFDVADSDHEFKTCIEQLGLNQKSQTFFYYELELPKKTVIGESQQTDMSALEIAETLSNLHPVRLDEVETWIQNKSIRTVSYEGRVTAAAQIFEYGDSAEINRIATNANFLRRGFSKALMQNICNELSQNGVKKLFLKVEDTRKPAINFYESFGFIKNESKTQTWFSKYF